MAVLENCEPKRVFHYFEEICKIPHGSGNTKQISDYLVQFAKDHDLKYVQDEMNNVVIYKPGTAGYENAPVVIIQGHMDMVCEKRPNVEHDFTKDGLNISVKDGYVTANGTTLGGDDGYNLFIDGKKVIDEFRPSGYRTSKYTMQLKAGQKYNIQIDYFQEGGGASANLLWQNTAEADNSKNMFVERLNEYDMIIACFGFNSDTESENSDRTFELPEASRTMIETVIKSKKPIIGVVNAGGNVEMQSWEPSLKGLLWSWYTGQESGNALANILFGEVSPSGKLPITFEKKWEDNPTYNSYYDPDHDFHVPYTEGIFVGYRGYDKFNREVQYPFGFGLSYTTFKLSDMRVFQDPVDDRKAKITCKLTNTGKKGGSEVVQLYIGKPSNNGVEQPLKELKSFKKVYLEPGQSAEVEMDLTKDSFSYYSVDKHDFVVDPGVFKLMLGVSSRNIVSQQNITLK